MQDHKGTNKNSELESLIADSDKLTSSLADVMADFNVSRITKIFDSLKCKGIAISSLLCVLLILPFYGVLNIYQLMRCGILKKDIEGKKTVYYDTLNNKRINWRKLLLFFARRFLYLISHNVNLKSSKVSALIFDDTLLEKTGKKIERVSYVYDHVSNISVLGYKLLVCGFWDGGSFIPLDFTVHREKGMKQEKLIKEHHKLSKQLEKQRLELSILEGILTDYEKKLKEKESQYKERSSKVNMAGYAKLSAKLSVKQAERGELQKRIKETSGLKKDAYNKLKRYYSSDKLYGLTAKERREQFKKAVSTQSHGFIRRKEADKSKIACMLAMLSRVVKAGIVPNYVLVDSWFFCYDLLEKLSQLKRGRIKLVSMVKMNNQLFTSCESDKELSVKAMLKIYERKQQRCKKLKAQYIRVKCCYKGIRVNLFFVRMGRSTSWHLLLTTDLGLSFIQVMEIYQIRWSIETFFKESKQYLHLAGCSSNTFEAQIAHITLSMIQSIMLSYFKRVNYQQSIGGLFEQIRHEICELDLVTRLITMFLELVEILCDSHGIDFITFHHDLMKNEKIQNRILKMLPEKVLKKTT